MNTYSLYLNNTLSGYYQSKAPYVSARKIFRAVSRIGKNFAGNFSFEFEIINIKTRTIYKYVGERTIANIKKTFTLHGEKREFICKYKYKVKRIYE